MPLLWRHNEHNGVPNHRRNPYQTRRTVGSVIHHVVAVWKLLRPSSSQVYFEIVMSPSAINSFPPSAAYMRQWTRSIGPLGTNLSKIWIEMLTISLTKMHLNMSSAIVRREGGGCGCVCVILALRYVWCRSALFKTNMFTERSRSIALKPIDFKLIVTTKWAPTKPCMVVRLPWQAPTVITDNGTTWSVPKWYVTTGTGPKADKYRLKRKEKIKVVRRYFIKWKFFFV